jgi:ElaB/YqjD/DUF883 family membrane-anchored ribosome-binding protein
MAKNRSFINNARERAQDAYDYAQDKVVRAKEKAEEKISENPWKSILIAAAVGAIVGVVTSELVHRHHENEKTFFRKFKDMF